MFMESNVRSLVFRLVDDNYILDEIASRETELTIIPPEVITFTHEIFIGNINNLIEPQTHKVLTIENFNKLEAVTYDVDCAICLKTNNDNIKLQCSHIFCKKCIEEWLTNKSNTCPICRKEV